MISNLVFSGGGIKCISYIGILKFLEERNLMKNIKHIIGTSGGAIFSLMVILGYSYLDLKNLILSIDFDKLKDITCENILKFNENFGIDTGEHLLNLIKIMIKKKNIDIDITFLDLYNKIKIQYTITGTCLEKNNIEYFNYKLTPTMKVIDAIRITFSIPIIYNCVRYNNYTYVDGGILDNYPIKFIKNDIENTLGFYILGEQNDKQIEGIDNFIIGILLSMIRKNEHKVIEKYKKNTIMIKCNFGSIDFNIDKETKLKAIENTYVSILKYFNEKSIKELLISEINNIINNIFL